MKFLVFMLSMIVLVSSAHAEKVRQPGWKDSNGMRSTSNNKISAGPKIISVEEHNKKNAAMRKAWASGEKPTVVKNKDGTTTIRRQLTQKTDGVVDRLLSVFN